MSDQGQPIRVHGIVRASVFDPGVQGKQFLGAVVECSDGTVWVLSYEEQSPYHALGNRQVTVIGEVCRPPGQHLIAWKDGATLTHLQAISVRPDEATGDTSIVEIGAYCELRGQFDRAIGTRSAATLLFRAETGDTFAVVNDPAGLRCGIPVTVCAQRVRFARPNRSEPYQWLWAICPYSANDLWEWRQRRL